MAIQFLSRCRVLLAAAPLVISLIALAGWPGTVDARSDGIVLRPGETWTGSLRVEGTLAIEARLLYEHPAGGAYALEIAVNGQRVLEPVLNKMSPMRYADGRNYPYREPNSARWLLFYSHDFAANNGPAGGGYEVKTDSGQAYRYAWNVASMLGGNPTAQVQIRNGSDPGGPTLEFRLLPSEPPNGYTTASPPPSPSSEPRKQGGLFGELVNALKDVAKGVAAPYGSSTGQGVPHLAVYTVPTLLGGGREYALVVQLQDGSGRPMYPAAPLTVTVTSNDPRIVTVSGYPTRTLTLRPANPGRSVGLSWDSVNIKPASAMAAGTVTLTATAPGLPGASVTVTAVPTRTPDNRGTGTPAYTAAAASVRLTVLPPITETDRLPLAELQLLDAQGQPTAVDSLGDWTLESSNPAVMERYSDSGFTVQQIDSHLRAPGQTQLTVVPKRPGLTGSSATLTAIAPGSTTTTTEFTTVPPSSLGAGILIEAEDETASGIRPLSERPAPNMEETAPEWRPPYSGAGDWYLAIGGEFLTYRVNVPMDATYYVWVRDYVDRFQPRGVRRILVEFDGRTYGTFPEVDKDAPGDQGAFGWHKIGSGLHLTAGTHTMKVTKEATTSGAAILDAFYLTTNVNDTPPEPSADNRYTSVTSQPSTPPASSTGQGVPHLAVYTVPTLLGHGDFHYPLVVQLQDGSGRPMYPAAPLTVTVTSSDPRIVTVYGSDRRPTATLTLRPADPGRSVGMSWNDVSIIAASSSVAGTATLTATAPGLPAASVTVTVVPTRTPDNLSTPAAHAVPGRVRLTVLPPITETNRQPLADIELLDAQGQPTGFDFGPGDFTLESSNPAVMEGSSGGWRYGQIGYPRAPGQTQLTVISKRRGVTGSSATLTAIAPGSTTTTTERAVPPSTVAVAPPVPMPMPPPTGATGRVAPGIDFGDPTGPSGRISNIVTARSVVRGAAVDITDRFTPDVNPIHVWFRVSGFVPGTALLSRWTYLGGSAPLVIGTGEFTIAPASDYGTFSYELAAGKRWPAGEYRIEILLGSTVVGSAAFVVR